MISDAREGLKAAAAAEVLGATRRRRRIHLFRNAMARVGPSQRAMVAAAIRTAFAQEAEEAAPRQWRQAADGRRERCRRLAEPMDGAERDVLASRAFHPDHWTKISSTNPLERLNGEIERRTDVVALLPTDAAVTRPAGAALLEQDDEWAVGRRCMSLETMAPLGHTEPVRLPAITA